MADNREETTSSNLLDGNEPRRGEEASVAASPKRTETQILTKLATSLTESYQLVKQRQQKYNELSSKLNASSSAGRLPLEQFEWQEVCTNKNKLKRKKILSASLTSVSDTVNQEKRTRIEGIQLNCRGKLALLAAVATPAGTASPLASKPPLPPTSAKRIESPSSGKPQPATLVQAAKVPPPRLKRKLQENMQTIQKLNALTDQLRLEINDLKSNLTTERGAVRVLRAQNESETRKWKNEIKKLQQAVELFKKSTSAGAGRRQESGCSEMTSSSASTGSLLNHEIQRLTNEISALKEANKASEERKVITGDADRRKAADIRELKDSYEIRLSQLTKSAKNEISRLLEEIKTKERNIGQLKKELQQQQRRQPEATKRRNATKPTTMETSNKTTNKTKKSRNQQKQQEQKKSDETTTETQQDNKTQDTATSTAQNPNEMKQLKDFELINNTRNLTQNNINNSSNTNNNNNFIHKTTKILNIAHNTKLKILDEPQQIDAQSQQHLYSNKTNNSNDDGDKNYDDNNRLTETQTNFKSLFNKNTNNINTNDDPNEQQQQQHHSLPHELLSQRFVETHDEYRGTKDNNSDSDSALSSAPPSISPQPPANGVETTDIWQSLRNYSSDMEKLQKDLDLLQKENSALRQELHAAKEQITEFEKSALAADNNSKLQQLVDRIRYLEEQHHQLQAESDELREQNELLEFRILELEDNTEKWSTDSHAAQLCTSGTTTSMAAAKDVWSCGSANNDDQTTLLFGERSNSLSSGMDTSATTLSGAMGPALSQKNLDAHLTSACDLNLTDNSATEELRRVLGNMQLRLPLNESELQCVHQMLSLLQTIDAISQRSGPNSLNTNSSDESNSFDQVKSRISDYSSASTASSAAPPADQHPKLKSSIATVAPAASSSNPRIVATVLPYSSTATYLQHATSNTPTDSPRKSRNAWQSNSLSESGVFVESDFLSDASENNAFTQTDFEEAAVAVCATTPTIKEFANELQNLQHQQRAASEGYSLSPSTISATVLCDPKRLQYYKDRLELLERKVLIYESSGDLQVKRLADRLQREIELEKQVKDLRDRVDFLEEENATLEEEKCEFEEAENDTRLRLQRLEVEQEIVSQRNVELDMSREALTAKYKECRSECLILRDDLLVNETQIRHLEEDKRKAKENFEFLHRLLPLFMLYGAFVVTSEQPHLQQKQQHQHYYKDQQLTVAEKASRSIMGNEHSLPSCPKKPAGCDGLFGNKRPPSSRTTNDCKARESDCLKEEVKKLRHQMKDLKARHYEAMESADSNWVEMEQDYKGREEAHRAKEACLKQKINRLQDCLRDDARAANEKITQLEDAENDLRTCLQRLSKEHRELAAEHQLTLAEIQIYKEENDKLNLYIQPLKEAYEEEKKLNKAQTVQLNFLETLQAEIEARNIQEMTALRKELFDVKKEFVNVEVSKNELKEEVKTLENYIETLKTGENESVDRIRVLMDELRNKEEMYAKLEKRLESLEGTDAGKIGSLAQEMEESPSKRAKREDVMDLHSASKGLGNALRNMKSVNMRSGTHKPFTSVACGVKMLADNLLGENAPIEEEDPFELLQQIEDKLNERLMNFHSRKMEDEFYCTVYYPVKRQVPKNIDDVIIS